MCTLSECYKNPVNGLEISISGTHQGPRIVLVPTSQKGGHPKKTGNRKKKNISLVGVNTGCIRVLSLNSYYQKGLAGIVPKRPKEGGKNDSNFSKGNTIRGW